ncbi:IclR family transcriptional regulator [Sphingomonas bisphenolicum]
MVSLVRSVSEAFSILRSLAAPVGAQRLTDLVRLTGISPSSCLSLLRTLVAEGAIELDRDKRYRLSPGWAGISALTDAADARLIARANLSLSKFASEHDAAVGLWRHRQRDRIELIALGESSSNTRIHMSVGQRQPLGSGAIGRALAAATQVDEAELAQRFATARWQRPLSFSDYKAQVEFARRHGHAVDDRYAFAGICSVSCVLPAEIPTYVLSASFFAGVRDDAEISALGSDLCELARSLGKR